MIQLDIGGRLIIPIRAIPEVTGRDIPPDEIAMILAEKAPRWRPKVTLTSYQFEQDKSFNPILPRDWDVAVKDLVTLRNKLELNQEIPDENHPDWREESIKRLLPGAFSWWDEFEVVHAELFPKRITTLLAGRHGDREINKNPPLSSKAQILINEGFGPLISDIDNVMEKDVQKTKEKNRVPRYKEPSPKTKKRYKDWLDEANRLWSKREHRNKGKSDIARLIEKSQVGDDRSWKTIRHKIFKNAK